MNEQEHRAKHQKLHEALDELAADYMSQTGKLLSETTVMELMQWSHEQTKNAPAIARSQSRETAIGKAAKEMVIPKGDEQYADEIFAEELEYQESLLEEENEE